MIIILITVEGYKIEILTKDIYTEIRLTTTEDEKICMNIETEELKNVLKCL